MKNQIPPPGIDREDFWNAVNMVDFSFTPYGENYKSTSVYSVRIIHTEATKNGVYEPYIDKVISITLGKLSELLQEIKKQRDSSGKSKRILFEERYKFKSIATDNFVFVDGEWSRLD